MELQSSSSHSQISLCSAAYHRKAWHIVSLLLSFGRPAPPAELADKCTFFPSSPEFVEFLCWIPNSPLLLTNNGFVTLSSVALVTFGRFVASSMLRIQIGGWTVPRSLGEQVIRTYYRKRKRLDKELVPSNKKRSGLRPLEEWQDEDGVPDVDWMSRVPTNSLQAYNNPSAPKSSNMEAPTFHIEEMAFNFGNFSNKMPMNPLKLNYRHPPTRIKDKGGVVKQSTSVVDQVNLEECQHVNLDDYVHQARRLEHMDIHSFLAQPPSIASPRADSIPLEETCKENFISSIANRSLPCMGIDKSCKLKLLDSPSAKNASEVHVHFGKMELEKAHDVQERNTKVTNSSDIFERATSFNNDIDKENMNDSQNDLVRKAVMKNAKCILSAYEQPVARGLQRKYPAKINKHQQDVSTHKLKDLSKLLEQTDDVVAKGKYSNDANTIPLKHKSKQIVKNNISIPERSGSLHLNSSKDNLVSKELPKFNLYVIEEEEGSGGYGTVYRARRKGDGIKFAIKYPHPNANKHHVDNERKMLERFGGRNFVIKYEGTCRSENSDCFILKYVEHDRPDVLRKDIDISELQWYGYCMFTALASLHKMGVVHRDVKPGNFLFSRKTCLGYVIDFNLAKDLHQKHANSGNSLNSHLKTVKPVSPTKRRMTLDIKASELAPGRLTRGLKSIESKMLRKKALNTSHRNSITSQGADGSGLTSTKDLTSARSPSAERLREPLPCQGRKELINLAQEAMQSPKQEVAGISAYKRKRIAAPPAIMGRKLVYYTPMPILSSGIAIPGSALLKEGGAGKVQKEGPCAGTKGFRAPEVLLRSMHQGPKLDVWSAGVTLIYLMIGKMPFTGEPEQNMKDIVKLRGSEELWELAKLHNRESSFPMELYDVRFVESMELRDWCKANTKRPEFLKVIPSSLFDLVDKCLTVNPRLRISAEEALRHEFFAPCFDTMRRDRLVRQQSVRVESVECQDNSHRYEGSIREVVRAI